MRIKALDKKYFKIIDYELTFKRPDFGFDIFSRWLCMSTIIVVGSPTYPSVKYLWISKQHCLCRMCHFESFVSCSREASTIVLLDDSWLYWCSII